MAKETHFRLDESQSGLAAAEYGRSDLEIGLAAVAIEQQLIGGQQEHIEGRPFALGELFELAGEGFVQGEDGLVPGQGLNGRARSIGGQVEYGRLTGQLLVPVFGQARAISALQQDILPVDISRILTLRRRQFPARI